VVEVRGLEEVAGLFHAPARIRERPPTRGGSS
jgi:hypothetical protein